ncbi:zinc-binding dehydrogenase [Jatrophihabitans sp. DSM 45814]
MYAIRQYEFGPPAVLRYEQVPDPVAGDGQVTVEVHSAGVHLIDTLIRKGVAGGPFPLPSLPMTPGREVAGIVTAVGPHVDSAWLGRRVVAHLGQASGGYATIAVAEQSSLHDIEGLDSATAIAMIGTGRTAVGVLELAEMAADDVVLVLAAAGGLGSLLVQEAVRIGATVVGCASGTATEQMSSKLEKIRSLGAIAVDYSQAGWADQLREQLGSTPPTLLLDGVGGSPSTQAARLVRPGGRIVQFGYSSGSPSKVEDESTRGKDTPRNVADLAEERGIKVSWVLGPRMTDRPGGLRGLETEALGRAARGEWQPWIQIFALPNAAGAHAALEERATTGKVVLDAS